MDLLFPILLIRRMGKAHSHSILNQEGMRALYKSTPMIFFGDRVNVMLWQLPQRSETVRARCAFCLDALTAPWYGIDTGQGDTLPCRFNCNHLAISPSALPQYHASVSIAGKHLPPNGTIDTNIGRIPTVLCDFAWPE